MQIFPKNPFVKTKATNPFLFVIQDAEIKKLTKDEY